MRELLWIALLAGLLTLGCAPGYQPDDDDSADDEVVDADGDGWMSDEDCDD